MRALQVTVHCTSNTQHTPLFVELVIVNGSPIFILSTTRVVLMYCNIATLFQNQDYSVRFNSALLIITSMIIIIIIIKIIVTVAVSCENYLHVEYRSQRYLSKIGCGMRFY